MVPLPELPEVETLRRDLEREVVGRKIKAVEVKGNRSIRRHTRKLQFTSRLEGQKITAMNRKGKYLLFKLDGGDLLVAHLGMSGQLLEPALEVLPRPLGRLGDAFAQQADDEAVGLRPAPVEVDRGDQGLHDVGQDRGLLPPAGLVLALAEQQRRAHLELGGDLGQHDRVHDRGPHLRQLALGEVAVGPEDVVGDGQTEDGVAQELEALVRHRAGRLCAPRAVGDGPSEQVGILEAVSQSAAEGLELRGQARQDAPSLATT